MMIILALLLLFAAVAAWLIHPILRGDADWPKEPGTEADGRMSMWNEEKDRLVGEMVALDIARAEGRISETDYNVQRSVVMDEAEKAAARLGKLRTESAGRTPVVKAYPILAASLAAAIVISGTAMTMLLNQNDIVAGQSPHADGRIPLPGNLAATGSAIKGQESGNRSVIGPDGAPDVGAMVARLEARVKEPGATVDDIVMLARSYRVLNREQEAISLYRRAQSMAPQNEELKLVVASVLIRSSDQSNLSEGEQIVDSILASSPKKPEALWLKSLGLIERHEIASAREILKQLSGLVDGNSDAKNAVGELLASLDQLPPDASKAKSDSTSAPATDPAKTDEKSR